jgi:hypothetical protein
MRLARPPGPRDRAPYRRPSLPLGELLIAGSSRGLHQLVSTVGRPIICHRDHGSLDTYSLRSAVFCQTADSLYGRASTAPCPAPGISWGESIHWRSRLSKKENQSSVSQCRILSYQLYTANKGTIAFSLVPYFCADFCVTDTKQNIQVWVYQGLSI